jgi:type VI secretion system protein ImpH
MEANGRRGSGPVENYGWGKTPPVETWLFAEGYQFDFFQAVRLLEMIHAADPPQAEVPEISRRHHRRLPRILPAEGADPSKEIVRFSSAVNLDFPTSDIAGVNSGNGATRPSAMVDHFKKREMPAEMTVNFLGLAGGLGALDIPTTELVLQRASRNDKALKDFLDIFNHRLVSLLYRIRKHHRVGLGVATPGEDKISRYLYSLIGLGTPNLQGRMQVRDRALLSYAGILAQQPRSMVGLERILADYFQVEVKGHQFKGEWCDLEESQWSTIGTSGRNQRLGHDTVIVGTRVWDQQARFDLHLGPLSFEEFSSFLPTNWRFGVLCDLIRFYVNDQFEFSIRLILKADEVPGTRLLSPLGPEPALTRPTEVSWTSWLGGARPAKAKGGNRGKARQQDNPYITISPESLRSEAKAIKSRVMNQLPRGKESELLAMMHPSSEPKSAVVMLQGKPGTSMFVIRSGKVQISRRDDKGKERVIGILGEGDTFGERALLMGKPYSETALTLTPCNLLEITGDQLEKVVVRYPSLGRTIEAYRESWRCGEKTSTETA